MLDEIKMRPYIDSEDSFYTRYDVDAHKPIIQKPTKKKDDSIITKKILVIMAVVAICKVAILFLIQILFVKICHNYIKTFYYGIFNLTISHIMVYIL
jgi:hypothetical protein